MTILLIIALLAIVFAVFAAVGSQGFWYNFITLVNVTFAAIVATNLFEPLAERIHYSWSSVSYLADFLAVWGIFTVCCAVLQLVSRYVAPEKVRLGVMFDQMGGFALSLVTGWILVCFVTMTLHTAPVKRDVFGNALLPSDDGGVVSRNAPDRTWLDATQRLSRGGMLGSHGSSDPSFDPQGKFILNYATRRYDYYRLEQGLFAERAWGAPLPLPEDDAN